MGVEPGAHPLAKPSSMLIIVEEQPRRNDDTNSDDEHTVVHGAFTACQALCSVLDTKVRVTQRL